MFFIVFGLAIAIFCISLKLTGRIKNIDLRSRLYGLIGLVYFVLYFAAIIFV